jgi:hypothetical protein
VTTRAIARGSLLVLLGVIAVLASDALYGRLFEGQVRQYEPSPDGNNIAEYRQYKQSGGATSTDLTTVELRTRLNPIRHTVLSGLDYGAKLSITWIDSRNLLITCNGCNPRDLLVPCKNCTSLDIVKKEAQWRDVSIHYAVQ